ncbi:hypothetical protein [Halomicrobium salinisoli]|uniref:hypothetical protein n=1 Tax=Halomicrobium salinisoli TaxID=2878391 RepID=UPI001CF0568F|nr:hypothetical protein [Halomicrobium salinisoli]
MSDTSGPGRVAAALSTDLDPAAVAMAGLVAAGVGYAGGGVLAGAPVGEFVPMLALLALCTVSVALALRGSE